MGRFLNADSYASTGQGLLGNNMFAYCGNNPVDRADSSGEIWHIAAGAIVGAGFGVITKIITNKISGEQWNSGLGTAAVAGAVSGGLAASGAGLATQVVGNSVISMANNAVDQLAAMRTPIETDTSFSFGLMLVDGAIGALAGYAGGPGAGSKNLTKIGLTNIKRTWNALTNKGVKAAATTLGKGLSYFSKNAKYMSKPLVTAITKSSATVVSSSFAKRLAAMERRLEFVYSVKQFICISHGQTNLANGTGTWSTILSIRRNLWENIE